MGWPYHSFDCDLFKTKSLTFLQPSAILDKLPIRMDNMFDCATCPRLWTPDLVLCLMVFLMFLVFVVLFCFFVGVVVMVMQIWKSFFLSNLTLWGYRFCTKKTHKLQQFKIAIKMHNSKIW